METETALLRSSARTSDKLKNAEPTLLPGSIAYLGEINSERSPYRLFVNPTRLSQLLRREFGFSAEQLEKVRIYIIGERPPKRAHRFTRAQRRFFFDPDIYKPSYAAINEDTDGNQHIMIYAFRVWEDLAKDKRFMIAQAKRKNKTEKSWEVLEEKTKQFKTEGRMRRYLNVAPTERVDAFLNRLMAIKARNIIRESIIHEVSHAREYGATFDTAFKKLKKMGLVQWFLEQMAERAEEKLTKKSEWADVIEFSTNKIAA